MAKSFSASLRVYRVLMVPLISAISSLIIFWPTSRFSSFCPSPTMIVITAITVTIAVLIACIVFSQLRGFLVGFFLTISRIFLPFWYFLLSCGCGWGISAKILPLRVKKIP